MSNKVTETKEEVVKTKPVGYGPQKHNQQKKGSNNNRARNGKRNAKRGVEPSRYGVTMGLDPANDVSWYDSNSLLFDNVCNLSYNTGMGARTGFGHDMRGLAGNELETIPGICVLKYAAIPGFCEDASSAVNIAANAQYSWVRHDNSGSANYDKTDLMLYYLAMDSAYCYAAWMRRLYGILGLYSQFNRYVPEGLITAQGVDPYNLRAHIVDLRYYINSYIAKLGSYIIPSNMTYIRRHMWMASHVYMDEPSLKAGLYLYTPVGFHKYDEMDGPGKLIFEELPQNMKFNDIVAYGDDLLGRLMSSEDIGIMSGDVLKAFGNDNIWKIDGVEADYTCIPDFSAEVLDQIHNTTIIPMGEGNYNTCDITQVVSTAVNGSYLVCKPGVSEEMGNMGTLMHFSFDRFLDATLDDPDRAANMVISRNTAFMTKTYENEDRESIRAVDVVGSEVFVGCDVWRIHYTSDNPHSVAYSVTNYGSTFLVDIGGESTDFSSRLDSMIVLFNKSPMFYQFWWSSETGAVKILIDYLLDINNYTLISAEVLKRMHEVALLSMFDVPQLGLYK